MTVAANLNNSIGLYDTKKKTRAKLLKLCIKRNKNKVRNCRAKYCIDCVPVKGMRVE